MKKRILNRKRTPLVILAALLIVLSAGVFVLAKLEIFSEDFIAHMRLNHIQVELWENGEHVSEALNDDSGRYRFTLSKLPTNGNIVPGRKYEEVISAKNSSDVDHYVRVIVRTYWVKEGSGEDDEEIIKDTALDPGLIKLGYKKGAYNSDEWFLNSEENTAESRTYYRKGILKAGEMSDLFDSITIDKSVLDDLEVTEEKKDGKIIRTYSYSYSGYRFYIAADVQALQVNNIEDALVSKWGITNVGVSGGALTLK